MFHQPQSAGEAKLPRSRLESCSLQNPTGGDGPSPSAALPEWRLPTLLPVPRTVLTQAGTQWILEQ